MTERAHEHVLPRLIDELQREGLLQYHLTGRDGWKPSAAMLAQHSDRVKHGGGTTGGAYMGVARVREGTPLRRIDIKVYPELLEASALLHFTGSGKFNRSLSRLANQVS